MKTIGIFLREVSDIVSLVLMAIISCIFFLSDILCLRKKISSPFATYEGSDYLYLKSHSVLAHCIRWTILGSLYIATLFVAVSHNMTFGEIIWAQILPNIILFISILTIISLTNLWQKLGNPLSLDRDPEEKSEHPSEADAYAMF